MVGMELLPSIESQIAIVIAIIIIAIFLVIYYRRAVALENRLKEKQSKAFSLGQSNIKGEIYQILGTFGLLNDYQELLFLGRASAQPSLDLLGVKEDNLDFIELKSKGAPLTSGERKIKKLVIEKKVNWITKDVELPEGFKITER